MLRSAFAHIFHGARGVSRPKVHEKRDRDEGTAGASREGPEGGPTAVVAVAAVAVAVTMAREREKKKRETFCFDRLMTNA